MSAPSTLSYRSDYDGCYASRRLPSDQWRHARGRSLSTSSPSMLESSPDHNISYDHTGVHGRHRNDGKCSSSSSAAHEQQGTTRKRSWATTNVTQIWKNYAKESTCHGLKFAVDHRKRKIARIAWFIITSGMLVTLVNTIVNLLKDYRTYPTVTRTDVQILNQPDFPSVTICNNSPFKNLNGTKTNPMFRAMARLSILRSFKDIIGNTSDPEYVALMAQTSSAVIDAYAFSKHDMIKMASYEETSLDVDDDFETVLTASGVCFTFNGPKYIAKHGIRKARFDGRSSGLKILVDVNQDLYIPYDTLTVGIRLYAAHYPDTPRFEKDGFDIGPGSSTRVALHPIQYKFLPAPYDYDSFGSGSCVDIAEGDMRDKMRNASVYSGYECLFQCRVHTASLACGCHTDMLYVEGLPSCTFGKFLNCMVPYFDQLKSQRPGLNVSCDCPHPCTSVRYNSVLSASKLPSTPLIDFYKVVNLSGDAISENVLEVRVFLNSMMLRTESHEPKYTQSSILGILGGQMGFCVGASLVTVAELGETLLVTAAFYIHKLYMKMCLGGGGGNDSNSNNKQETKNVALVHGAVVF